MAGVLMLLPGACTLVSSAPNRDDAGVAFTEVARIRLDSFRAGSPIRLVFRVPDTAQWKRLRESWGSHGYIVYAEGKENSTIIPLAKLNLDLSVSRAGRSVEVQKSSGCPYMVSIASSSDIDDCAMVFKPTPGEELEVALTPRSSENLPAGDFVIQPYWGGSEKDLIVNAMIDSDVQPYMLGAAAIGVILLIASSILAINSTRGMRRT